MFPKQQLTPEITPYVPLNNFLRENPDSVLWKKYGT